MRAPARNVDAAFSAAALIHSGPARRVRLFGTILRDGGSRRQGSLRNGTITELQPPLAMTDQICEDLIQSVGKHGESHVEVARGDANDFTVRSVSKSPGARCTVTLLDHEPTFHVNFDLVVPAINGVTFNVSGSEAHRVAPSASRVFQMWMKRRNGCLSFSLSPPNEVQSFRDGGVEPGLVR